MPSKRFWAKKNPKLDFEETVNKTEYFVKCYDFKKSHETILIKTFMIVILLLGIFP